MYLIRINLKFNFWINYLLESLFTGDALQPLIICLWPFYVWPQQTFISSILVYIFRRPMPGDVSFARLLLIKTPFFCPSLQESWILAFQVLQGQNQKMEIQEGSWKSDSNSHSINSHHVLSASIELCQAIQRSGILRCVRIIQSNRKDSRTI